MRSLIFRTARAVIETISRSFSSKRPIPPQLLFHLDTKAIYGPQMTVQKKRSTKSSDFDFLSEHTTKQVFERDTESLYAGSRGLRRACSLPKGVSITERQRYLRHLFRIPRGQPISLYPQAYVPDKYLGLRRKKPKT